MQVLREIVKAIRITNQVLNNSKLYEEGDDKTSAHTQVLRTSSALNLAASAMQKSIVFTYEVSFKNQNHLSLRTICTQAMPGNLPT